MFKNILNERIRNREISHLDPIFEEISDIQYKNLTLVNQLNTGVFTQEDIRQRLGNIIGDSIDESVNILLPFHKDFGKHIKLGKDIYISMNTVFVDLGGITLEDRVLIGPGAYILSVNHILDPEKRRGLVVKPVLIKENAWIGAKATILPGVTIGKNSIVSADATVTKDVPDNVIVAGTPARVIKEITDEKQEEG